MFPWRNTSKRNKYMDKDTYQELYINESEHDKTYNKICVTSKDSYQPVHPSSIARVFHLFHWIAWWLEKAHEISKD